MKGAIARFVTAMSIVVCASIASGEKAPVVLTHGLTGYSEGADATALEYTLQVRNPGNMALANLSLSLVPRPPMMMKPATVSIGNLAPKGTVEVKVKTAGRGVRDKGSFSRTPLSFAGKYTDARRKVVEFPVQSEPGGAK